MSLLSTAHSTPLSGGPPRHSSTGGVGPRGRADRLADSILSCITTDSLEVQLPDGSMRLYGKLNCTPSPRWLIQHPDTFARVLRGGALALGETYLDGWWDVGDDRLSDFLGVLLKNDLRRKISENLSLKLRLLFNYLLTHPRHIPNACRNAIFHYDLGNNFFSLMLDPTMTYSCAYQRSTADSLQLMQEQKLDLICRKLNLAQGGTLVDVGCGWGSLLFHAALHYPNIEAVGITPAREQFDYASRRAAELGLSDRVSFRLGDYREIDGEYDFFVSVGMFEHVGRRCMDGFMHRMAHLLKPGGRGLLHTMGVTSPMHWPPDAWFSRYVFPGHYVPRLEELSKAMRMHGLLIAHCENLRPHYALTLRKWKENFEANWQKIESLSPDFDQRFKRLWNYYLQGLEAGYLCGKFQLYQLLFSRGEFWQYPAVLGWESPEGECP